MSTSQSLVKHFIRFIIDGMLDDHRIIFYNNSGHSILRRAADMMEDQLYEELDENVAKLDR